MQTKHTEDLRLFVKLIKNNIREKAALETQNCFIYVNRETNFSRKIFIFCFSIEMDVESGNTILGEFHA